MDNKVREYFSYEPDTGIVRWKKMASSRALPGCEAGSITNGYRVIRLEGKNYSCHRVGFFLHYGRWPKGFLDHKNGIRHDNRIENLRECQQFENMQNLSAKASLVNKTSRFTGVTWNKRDKRFKAQIKVRGKKIFLGNFKDEESAHKAYIDGKARLHTFNPIARDLDEVL